MSYPAIDLIDTGKVMPRLGTLMRMQELRGVFTLDELVYGRNPPKLQRVETELSTDAIKALLFELGADHDATEALGIHATSAAGKFVRFTRSYVAAFVERYRLARTEGLPREAAIDAAKQTAVNAQANTQAVAARLKPVSAPQLEVLGRKIKDSAADRTGVVPSIRKGRKRA